MLVLQDSKNALTALYIGLNTKIKGECMMNKTNLDFKSKKKEILPIKIDGNVVNLEIDSNAGVVKKIASIGEQIKTGKKEVMHGYVEIFNMILSPKQIAKIDRLDIQQSTELLTYILKQYFKVDVNANSGQYNRSKYNKSKFSGGK
jgi:hypothetical protein